MDGVSEGLEVIQFGPLFVVPTHLLVKVSRRFRYDRSLPRIMPAILRLPTWLQLDRIASYSVSSAVRIGFIWNGKLLLDSFPCFLSDKLGNVLLRIAWHLGSLLAEKGSIPVPHKIIFFESLEDTPFNSYFQEVTLSAKDFDRNILPTYLKDHGAIFGYRSHASKLRIDREEGPP